LIRDHGGVQGSKRLEGHPWRGVDGLDQPAPVLLEEVREGEERDG
jgi:hypothetical protein